MKEKVRNQLKKWIKGDLRDLYWRIYGHTIRNPMCQATPRSFLFICKGNICRSPFAEHLARKLAGNAVRSEKALCSAGLQVSKPLPPPKEAILAAESFGIQLNSHKSRKITKEMLESFDMIIAMETWQVQAAKKAFPNYKEKIFLLPLFYTKDWVKRGGFSRFNIQDPYGKNLNEFHVCFNRIKECIEGLFR